MSGAITQIRHPASVRAVVLSPVSWQPLQAVTALENGNIYMYVLTSSSVLCHSHFRVVAQTDLMGLCLALF